MIYRWIRLQRRAVALPHQRRAARIGDVESRVPAVEVASVESVEPQLSVPVADEMLRIVHRLERHAGRACKTRHHAEGRVLLVEIAFLSRGEFDAPRLMAKELARVVVGLQ